MESQAEAIQFSIPLPRSLDTRISIHLTLKAKVILLFLTTAAADDGGSNAAPAAMGSFVYALPDRLNPTQPLSTAIYSVESSVEFTTRMARLLARRAHMPVYVGNSMNFTGAPMGGTVEEEMEAFKAVADVVTEKLKERGVTKTPGVIANGVQTSS